MCIPLTNIATRGSSTSFGARASKARFERAFFGFLDKGVSVMAWLAEQKYAYTVLNIVQGN